MCAERHVPPIVQCERDWRCLKVAGPLDLSLTEMLASLAAPFAEVRIALFAVSTYDTDYLPVKEADVGRVVEALRGARHTVQAG